jgi:hypothetical protein
MVEFTVLDLYHEVRSLNSELIGDKGILEVIFWERNNTNTS